MTRRRRSLSEEDRRLWAHVTKDVKPLAPAPPPEASVQAMKAAHEAPRNAEEAVRAATEAATPPPAKPAGPAQKPPEPRHHHRPSAAIDRRTLRKLARGTMRIEGRLDLHGMTQEEAHHALARFIETSVARRRRIVLVITGKGTGGEGRGILRRQVPHWLGGREIARHVVGYREADPVHGGDGALYVRLRAAR